MVTGLVRLDPSVDPSSNAATLPGGIFDAWPTKAQRKESKERRRATMSRIGLGSGQYYSPDEYDYGGSSESEEEDSDDYDESEEEDDEESGDEN